MTSGARFWAVDLHVHTPASRDVDVKRYGASTPQEVVDAAINAGLDAIAVTDHNTSAWCDTIAEAAEETSLLVLPGVEISTTEGHLLAIWEHGTPSGVIDELLVRLGIPGNDQGKLDIAAEVGFASAAQQVALAGGLAIAAHVDRPKGLLQLPVAAHLKRSLLEPSLAAVEVVDTAAIATVTTKVSGERVLACIRSSDCTLPQNNIHVLAGIGHRRTWIKASRPDLVGLKHAFEDPDLRIRLDDPATMGIHPWIEEVAFTNGFLDGQRIELSPDLSCLLGGTGAGKSLVLEGIRYALGQQVDGEAFPAIRQEVDSRLAGAVGPTGVVRVVVTIGDRRIAIERAFSADGNGVWAVATEKDGTWIPTDDLPPELLSISAFSQGEALEYSREPVGRMTLVDAGIDFGDLSGELASIVTDLRENAGHLLAQRATVAQLRVVAANEQDLESRVQELAALFDKDVVKQQNGWKNEAAAVEQVVNGLPKTDSVSLVTPDAVGKAEIETNADLFSELEVAVADLKAAVEAAKSQLSAAVDAARSKILATETRWRSRLDEFRKRLDDELAKVGDGASLIALRGQLEKLQGELVDVQKAKVRLEGVEIPRLIELKKQRDELLDKLNELRNTRRQLRRDRAAALNSKTAGIVKLDLPSEPDAARFRSALETFTTGSRVRVPSLDAIATRIHPFRLARALLDGDITSLVNDAAGIDSTNLARILANLDDRNLWSELLEAQICEMPDKLNVKFRKPDDGVYAAFEQLAHGQRCTAILVVLLADGDSPVIVDQPEDALHAPWIEEYLVDRLRGLRGERQYIFATRSPGIVVGADAEQIITMRATSGKGEVEAVGSLERHDLNRLTLHHLEGGPMAFHRRSRKLDVSVRPS